MSFSSDREFVVKSVDACQSIGGVLKYLVVWDGFEEEDATWEPEENLLCGEEEKDKEMQQHLTKLREAMMKKSKKRPAKAAAAKSGAAKRKPGRPPVTRPRESPKLTSSDGKQGSSDEKTTAVELNQRESLDECAVGEDSKKSSLFDDAQAIGLISPSQNLLSYSSEESEHLILSSTFGSRKPRPPPTRIPDSFRASASPQSADSGRATNSGRAAPTERAAENRAHAKQETQGSVGAQEDNGIAVAEDEIRTLFGDKSPFDDVISLDDNSGRLLLRRRSSLVQTTSHPKFLSHGDASVENAQRPRETTQQPAKDEQTPQNVGQSVKTAEKAVNEDVEMDRDPLDITRTEKLELPTLIKSLSNERPSIRSRAETESGKQLAETPSDEEVLTSGSVSMIEGLPEIICPSIESSVLAQLIDTARVTAENTKSPVVANPVSGKTVTTKKNLVSEEDERPLVRIVSTKAGTTKSVDNSTKHTETSRIAEQRSGSGSHTEDESEEMRQLRGRKREVRAPVSKRQPRRKINEVKPATTHTHNVLSRTGSVKAHTSPQAATAYQTSSPYHTRPVNADAYSADATTRPTTASSVAASCVPPMNYSSMWPYASMISPMSPLQSTMPSMSASVPSTSPMGASVSPTMCDVSKARLVHLGRRPYRAHRDGYWGLIERFDGTEVYLPMDSLRKYYPQALIDYLLHRVKERPDEEVL